jgi:Fe2+ or Zn2+ uptake regulation protein
MVLETCLHRELEELGIIRLFDLLGETRIEVNKHPHINIINLRTGEIRDYNDDKLLNEVRIKLGLNEAEFILVNILVYEKGW